MADFIVLVKQVPDVKQITDNAFDLQTGTLIRTRLPSVINELDTHALAFANYMKQISFDRQGRIIVLTMGPPMAEEVLRYCLSRCADIAVLLTDKALGGADTFATANPLSFAVRKIVKQILNSTDNYYIVTGMQSLDGDTAQVPAQIAEELSLPCIAYATDTEFKNNRFEFIRIISGGNQLVAAKSAPAVITVAKYEYPVFATFAQARRANALKIIQWSGDDIGAPHIGVAGSKTRVIRVFPPSKSKRSCQRIEHVKELAHTLAQSLKDDSQQLRQDEQDAGHYVLPKRRKVFYDRSFESTDSENEDFKILADKLKQLGIERIEQIDEYTKKQILDTAGEYFHVRALEDMLTGLKLTDSSYQGEVWVVAEHHNGKIHPATFELIGKACSLADSLETKVGVCLPGDNVRAMADDLIVAGADNIYVIADKLLAAFDPAVVRKAVADCIEKYQPQIVLFAATPQGRSLAPMVSYRLRCGLTADCTGLDIRDSTRKGQIGILLQTRPALGGNVMATICTKDSKLQMATARPGVMKSIVPDPSRKGKIIEHSLDLSADDKSLEIIKTEHSTGRVDFAADIIVSGGKGMQNRDNYETLVGSLCHTLAEKLKVKVERGASRAAVERGFIDRVHQVGQTGTSVNPEIYVALGISGAIQHMIGIANSKTIIAVNNDPDAPIFKNCDYYVVGNVEDIIPTLIGQL